MKVQLVPFHTPQADSFCHSWAMTSSSESARLRSSLRAGAWGGRVGVAERERLWTLCWCRFRGDGDREREPEGERWPPCRWCWGWRCEVGAVEVK
jgi:hypothetical protein